ncbi:maleylpyruvate isomerase family mycothiol-dependent enzyme [Dermacoccaceae bacterium W4C1]
MESPLSLAAYVDGLNLAIARIAGYREDLDEQTPVPTCPGWDAEDLAVHLGTVHRWATAVLGGAAPRDIDTELFDRQGREAGDLMAWLGHGADRLSAALLRAPEDLDVWFFLPDAPPPRLAWARRQCHEATIHAFDALTAAESGIPAAVEAGIAPEVAADGVDELLRGFAPRGRHGLRTDTPIQVEVFAQDTGDRWLIQVDAQAWRARPVTAATAEADLAARLSGSAAQLYLGLWNRGREIEQQGLDVLDLWRDRMKVTF